MGVYTIEKISVTSYQADGSPLHDEVFTRQTWAGVKEILKQVPRLFYGKGSDIFHGEILIGHTSDVINLENEGRAITIKGLLAQNPGYLTHATHTA